jgi:hypothetical protein
MTQAQVIEYSDFEDLILAAEKSRLAVLTYPRPKAARDTHGPTLDIFVAQPGEEWRARAFIALQRALFNYQWSDSSEYLSSVFLGFGEDDCRSWIEHCRFNRLGWTGQTVYTLFKRADTRRLEALAFRCFPRDFPLAGSMVIAHPDDCQLRPDLDNLLPDNIDLCRFALDNDFFLSLFQDADCAFPTKIVTASALDFNEALVSHIEVWTPDGWTRSSRASAAPGDDRRSV